MGERFDLAELARAPGDRPTKEVKRTDNHFCSCGLRDADLRGSSETSRGEEAGKEQKRGGVRAEHSWICMPLMYHDDA